MAKKLESKITDLLEGFDFILKGVSYLALNPGDIIYFNYEGTTRFGLVVASAKASRGMFLSTQNNTLINVVELSRLTTTMFSLMVDNIYKNRVVCKYKSPALLGVFLGKDNFKTFNAAKMANITSLEIGR